jgi:hypothetical protein
MGGTGLPLRGLVWVEVARCGADNVRYVYSNACACSAESSTTLWKLEAQFMLHPLLYGHMRCTEAWHVPDHTAG